MKNAMPPDLYCCFYTIELCNNAVESIVNLVSISYFTWPLNFMTVHQRTRMLCSGELKQSKGDIIQLSHTNC
jgi:hypothetical protein